MRSALFIGFFISICTGNVFAQNTAKAGYFFEERNFAKAAEILQKVHNSDSNSALAYVIAECHRKERNFQLAQSWYKRSIAWDEPFKFEGYILNYIQQGSFKKAKDFLETEKDNIPSAEYQQLKQMISNNEGLKSKDSLWVLAEDEVIPIFKHQEFAHHTSNDVFESEKPEFVISSIYPDKIESPKILRQNESQSEDKSETHIFGLRHKGKNIGIHILKDENDFSYYVYKDILDEFYSHEHLDEVKSQHASIKDGELINVIETPLFKNDRAIKYPSFNKEGKD